MLGTTLRVARALAVSVMAAVVVTAAPAGTSDYCWDRCDFAAPCDTECMVDYNEWMTCLDWGDCDFCDYANPTCGNGMCEPLYGCEWSCSCPDDCGPCSGHTPYYEVCTYGEPGACPANYSCNEDGVCVPAKETNPGPPPTIATCISNHDCPVYPGDVCVHGVCVSEYHWPVSR